jgi:gliding motility-associated-like protein
MKNFFLVSAMALCAQWVCAQACFKINPLKGCAPMTINITNCSSVSPQFYMYGDEGTGTATSFTFKTPGIKKVVQFVGGGGAITDTIEVEVLASTDPEFEVFLCQNNGASVQITNPGSYDVFFVDFGFSRDTILASERSFFYYPASGNQSIEIQGNYQDTAGNFGSVSCAKSRVSFKVQSNLEPLKILSISSRNDSLLLQTQNRPNLLSILQERQSDNSALDLDRNRSNSMALEGDFPRCFRLAVRDNCGSEDILGPWVCSAKLKAEPQSDWVELTWPLYAAEGFTRYNLYRDEKLVFSSTSLASNRYLDRNVRCLQRYCYRLEVLVGSVKVLSDSVCVVANSSVRPPLPRLAAASVLSDSLVEIFWQIPQNAAIARTWVGGQIQLQTTATRVQDRTARPQSKSFCYFLSLQDSCQNRSRDSAQICTIWLSSLKSGRDNALIWSTFEGFEDNFFYEVEVLDRAGNLLRNISPIRAESYTDPATAFTAKLQVYRIKAVSVEDPTQVAYSNQISIEEKHIITLPTAFTPNDDGLNDKLFPISSTTASLEMVIFNRWGERVFVSTSLDQGWDGTYQGQAAPVGVYHVQIEGRDVFGDSFKLNEKVQLIR